MKRFLLVVFLVNITLAHAGFEPPVIIQPQNPHIGSTIRVGLFEMFYPPCLELPVENIEGETYDFEIVGNEITVNVLTTSSLFCDPMPISPAPREYYELGQLPEGEYLITVNFIETGGLSPEFIPAFPLPDIFVPAQFGNPVTFSVRGTPQAVDGLSGPALLILFATLLFLTYLRGKKLL